MVRWVCITLVFSLMIVQAFGAGALDWDGLGEADWNEYELKPLSIVDMTTDQSSTYQDKHSSDKAVDGDTDNGFSHTKSDANPYWRVKLGGEHCIGKVTIYNRVDCCGERLIDAIVRAGVNDNYKLNERCGQRVTDNDRIVEVFCNPPLLAHEVSVDIPRQEFLQLQEVLVEEYPIQRCYRLERRLSILHCATEQSSTCGEFRSELAADSFIATKSLFSHTGVEQDPWWRVTLQGTHCISKVTLYNREDCCSERLANAVVRAGESADIKANKQCGAQLTADQVRPHGGIYDLYCGPPLKAHYVSVDIPRNDYLQLREVEIEELNADPCENDEWDFSIIGRPTRQSSYYDQRYTPDKAADGNRDTRLSPDFKCAHTKEEMDPWWLVDLEGVHCISRVFVVNRGDCCSDRLTHAVVRAGTNVDFHANPVCGSPVSPGQAAQPGGTIEFKCNVPVEARYVSVDIPSGKPQYLQLCEVTVKKLMGENACHPPESEEEIVTNLEPLPKEVVEVEQPLPVPHGNGP